MTGGAQARPGVGRARLSRSADFDRVFRRGRSHASRELVLYVFPRDDDGRPRLGLSVSRKVGGAVQRNRVKRRLRHLVASELVGSAASCDVVVRALPGAATEPGRLPDDLSSAWSQVLQRLSPGRSRVSP
jgi:ribonuclease P protein component